MSKLPKKTTTLIGLLKSQCKKYATNSILTSQTYLALQIANFTKCPKNNFSSGSFFGPFDVKYGKLNI